MDRFAHYDWPFFEPRHARARARGREPGRRRTSATRMARMPDAICKRLVQDLGCAGFLHHCVSEKPDVRSIALLREVFAYHAGLADFSFVMQGLGSGPIALAGDASQKKKYLPQGGERRRDRGIRAVRARRRLRRAGADDHGAPARQTAGCSTAPRPGSRTAASPTSTSCSRRPRRASAPSSSTRAKSTPRERIDIVAPHPMAIAAPQGLQGHAAGRGGAGLQAGDAQPRHLPHHGRRGAALGFARRALDEVAGAAHGNARCSARRSPTSR